MASLRGLDRRLYPWAAALLDLAAREGWDVAVTSVRRSYSQQARLYRNYLRGLSRYPAAPPGRSLHQVGRAFDLRAAEAVLERLGAIWEQWGGTWGGRGEDPIHFEA